MITPMPVAKGETWKSAPQISLFSSKSAAPKKERGSDTIMFDPTIYASHAGRKILDGIFFVA